MRVAHLANFTTPNGFYRGVGPMMRFAARGNSVLRLTTDDHPVPLASVRNVDLLHIHRYCDERALRLVREAKAHGAAVIWDNDDDMGSIPKGTISHRKFGALGWERRLAAMRIIFRVADLVTAPSAVLAERLAGYGAPRVAVIENHVPASSIMHPTPDERMFTIGWTAGLEHQFDLERLPIRAALQRILDERPGVQVVSVGLGLGLRSERYRKVDSVPLTELSRQTAQFDVGIAPLADVPFNRARSNIKVKEYAAGGAPWLASPVAPYADLGEREGGRLVNDDDWHAALCAMIDRPRERRKLAKRAAKWVAGETLEARAKEWESHMREAVAHAAATAAQR